MSARRAATFAALVAAAATMALAGVPAQASGAAPKEVVDEVTREFDRSRAKLDRAVDLVADGDREQAHAVAVSAYLDHYERVEPPLRVLDPDLTLEIEERYAEVRARIDDPAASARDVSASTSEVRNGLTEFEQKISEPGSAAGLVAAASSFSIIFREGLEMVLLLAALVAFLERSEQRRFRRPVVLGVAGAVGASVVTFLALEVLLGVAPVQRELLEAVLTVVSVVLLFTISFWLLRRLEHRRWMEFVRARFWTAMASGSTLAVAAVAFTAAYREGFETVLFYQSLLGFTGGMGGWVAGGFAAGVGVLAVVAWLILVARHRVPVRAFMTAALSLVMLMSVAFLGNAVNQLQNLDLVPATSLLGEVPRLPVFWAQLTGVHPTTQSLAAQAVLVALYGAGFAWLLVARRRDESGGAVPAPPSRAAGDAAPSQVAAGVGVHAPAGAPVATPTSVERS